MDFDLPTDARAADSWFRLSRSLQEAVVICRSDYKPPLDLTQPLSRLEAVWLPLVANHRNSGDKAIERWVSERLILEADPEARFLLHCRFFAAIRFAGQFVFYRRNQPHTILPFPAHSQEDVLRWLLIRWWDARGHRDILSYFLPANDIPHE